jgi:hypothetical protein
MTDRPNITMTIHYGWNGQFETHFRINAGGELERRYERLEAWEVVNPTTEAEHLSALGTIAAVLHGYAMAATPVEHPYGATREGLSF